MDITRMPGFSADASLYRSRAHYQAGVMLPGTTPGGEIVPSLSTNCISVGSRTHCCVSEDDRAFGACCCSLDTGCVCSYRPRTAPVR